jgi:hypothetical protein
MVTNIKKQNMLSLQNMFSLQIVPSFANIVNNVNAPPHTINTFQLVLWYCSCAKIERCFISFLKYSNSIIPAPPYKRNYWLKAAYFLRLNTNQLNQTL